ncbi:MAG: bifunctional YncE family protein/alkaline phosphatase family protein [Planctomycetia bacterium]|nr:bifunctional YncE family protein/alkaline phosphatase family protein [Planctomycetia bacterium]
MNARYTAAGAICVLLLLAPVSAQPKAGQAKGPGQTDDGFRLPNGWTLTPAGEQVTLTDMPLNIIPLADNRHALVASSGYNQHELCLVDLVEKKIVDRERVRQSWFGLAANRQQNKLWWAGGGADILHTYDLVANDLARTGADEPSEAGKTREERQADRRFRSGVTLSNDGRTLYSLDINSSTIRAIDLSGKTEDKVVKIGNRPYDVVMARNGDRLYVSDWAARLVLALDPADLHVVQRIGVGEHPNQFALHPTDDRLFVACASANCVSAIDTRRGVVTETIMTSLFSRAPEGSTPDALVVSPDGETLYVANADNNCVVVVDIEEPNKSQVKGMIPTGWYPTSVAMTPDGKNLLVGVGKGNQTQANPIPPAEDPKDKDQYARRRLPFPYIGTTLSGSLSIIPVPNDEQLKTFTNRVYKNCPYSDKLLAGTPGDAKTAIPTKIGDPSPIKYVIYIIKENRTYDQVFGDIPGANGDPSLVMFGEDITPNHHKLAREYVVLDNLYCNGQVSRDGHPWSTMAYNTDYTARDWTLTYSSREGVADDDDGDLANAPSGYIWDACARAGLSYRSYGEYGRRVSQPDGTVRVEGAVPGLTGHMCPDYGIPKMPGQRSRDTDNVETFLREFHEFEAADSLPRFIVMSLGENHTSGTTPGAFTPQACVASNDLALGRLVEAVSKSKFWPQMAIFVIEDDAQNGADHVDAHRTCGLVIGPYAKRKVVDSTQYTTVSMLRTIELILGLPPLSQYDAAANPMYGSFSDRADTATYAHLPARIDLDAKNTALSYGAERSSKMDFSEYDRVDDFELNEILWYAVKGENAPLPPAVRRAIAYRNVAAK